MRSVLQRPPQKPWICVAEQKTQNLQHGWSDCTIQSWSQYNVSNKVATECRAASWAPLVSHHHS